MIRFASPARLRAAGVLGINRRNAELTLPGNPRRALPRADDKRVTKELLAAAGIATPKLYATVRAFGELRGLLELLAPHPSFVIKPARGAMGEGILIVLARDGDRFVLPGGRALDERGLRYGVSGILSGLYSLCGRPDRAMVEERVEPHEDLARLAPIGVPDLRVIVYRGEPAMAMLRLPTRASGGRANLHQGAVAVGVDLETGRTVHALLGGAAVEKHPDSQAPLAGVQVPHWPDVVALAARAARASDLAYVGADVVLDRARGPLVLEINARPGLTIQLANRKGLLPALRAIEARTAARGLSPMAGHSGRR